MHKTIIFTGPSAIGKTFAADSLMAKYPDKFEQSKLYTTRDKRAGENPSDRFFINDNEFDEKVKSGDFIFHDHFGGSRYGFTKESIYPKNRHLLLNAWPWLTKDFSEFSHTIIVGMQAPKYWKDLLISRMKQRGDNDKTIKVRIGLISKDIDDLYEHQKFVKASGKLFIIDDDSVVTDKVIPWIEKKLDLLV